MTLFVGSAAIAEGFRTVPIEGICQLYLGTGFETSTEWKEEYTILRSFH
jgi:hypothetical protein